MSDGTYHRPGIDQVSGDALDPSATGNVLARGLQVIMVVSGD
jgi:hypothetical protein